MPLRIDQRISPCHVEVEKRAHRDDRLDGELLLDSGTG